MWKKEVPHLYLNTVCGTVVDSCGLQSNAYACKKLIINYLNYQRGLYLGAPYTSEISVAIIREMQCYK